MTGVAMEFVCYGVGSCFIAVAGARAKSGWTVAAAILFFVGTLIMAAK